MPESVVFAAAVGGRQTDDIEFVESELASVFQKYKELSKEDRDQVRILIGMLDNEIERRLR